MMLARAHRPRLTLPALPRPLRLGRFVALASALALAGCGGGDSTGPSESIDGTYSLTAVQGQSVPFGDQANGIDRGNLSLDNGAYTLVITVRQDGASGDVQDSGTFRRDGSRVRFSSTGGAGEAEGTLSNSNRTLSVDLDGAPLRFERP